jgi:hypothetical protein
MLLLSLINWWYGDGWRRRARLVGDQIATTTDFFSLSLLVQTLFQPFRQISAGPAGSGLEAYLRALLDKFISRMIGTIVRVLLMITGLMAILFHALIGCVILLGWAVVPALPVIGIILMLTGWAF